MKKNKALTVGINGRPQVALIKSELKPQKDETGALLLTETGLVKTKGTLDSIELIVRYAHTAGRADIITVDRQTIKDLNIAIEELEAEEGEEAPPAPDPGIEDPEQPISKQ